MTLMEIERRRHHQQPVRPGEALELDAERAPHAAARAVGADQLAAGVGLALRRCARSRPSTPTIRPASRLCTAAVERDLEARLAAQLLVAGCASAWIARTAPGRDGRWRRRSRRNRTAPAGRASWCGTGTPARSAPARSAARPRRARRSMSSVGGWNVEARDSVAEVGARLEHRDRHAGAHQIGGGDEPDRPRAGDEDAFL